MFLSIDTSSTDCVLSIEKPYLCYETSPFHSATKSMFPLKIPNSGMQTRVKEKHKVQKARTVRLFKSSILNFLFETLQNVYDVD